MISLNELGNRICIIGCSNSGKSTLADSLSKKLDIPAYHLDQYAHVENTDWQRQSDDILVEKHNALINTEFWIIDGNYSICMGARLDRATSVIWLDPNVFSCVIRYLFRSLKNDINRPGKLAGVKKEFNFSLTKWIISNYPKNRVKYAKLLGEKNNLKIVKIHSISELNQYYKFFVFRKPSRKYFD
ncbi:MAG: adenylate kinase [Gammaproteobacteria bacterium]|nr:adenylate kinase [Gammaproteobacteria bacterium]